jgi:hypothetical protein
MLVILATFSGASRKNIAATNTAIMLFALASLRRRATLENELVLLHITELDAIRSAATNSIFSIAIDPQKFGTMASGAFPAGSASVACRLVARWRRRRGGVMIPV